MAAKRGPASSSPPSSRRSAAHARRRSSTADKHQQSPSSSSIEKVPLRKRRCTTKTRNGCLTCKRRRIRCDEHKPQCWNCLKSKERDCEGYQPPKPWLFQRDAQLDAQFPLDAHTSPPGSATASSGSNTSATSSSNPSASTTPTGADGPKGFQLFQDSRLWSPTAPQGHLEEAPSYFLPFPPAASTSIQQSVTLAAPIIRTASKPLWLDGLEPGDVTTAPSDTNYSPSSLAPQCPEDNGPSPLSTAIAGPLIFRHRPPRPHLITPGHEYPYSQHDRHHALPTHNFTFGPFTPLPSPLTLNPASTPFTTSTSTARSFAFYIRHSGAAMGARSSPSFFLSTIPQIASRYSSVRYALLAVALVDESVDDHGTHAGLYGPGVQCVNVEARRSSFEMYGRAVRALVEAGGNGGSASGAEKATDDSLVATLCTCLLLFSFENWLWNIKSAGWHLDGAMGLIAGYERGENRQGKRGLLQEEVLPMMKQAAKFHNLSVDKGIPASKFGEGATWAPKAEDTDVGVGVALA